jgi:diguanylate cyclase (GGDEF)-like protein
LNLANNFIINIYSILLLVFICFQSLKDTERKFLQQRLFLMLSLTTILMLIADAFSRLDGHSGTIYPILNHIGNFVVFLLNLFIPSIWLLYTHFQVFHDEKKTKRLLCVLSAANATNIVLLVLSQHWGWLYSIDAKNIYHRGPLFWLPTTITFILAITSIVIIFSNRKKIERKHFISILFFPVPPLICMILQIIFYGTSLMLNGLAFSLFILFINIQNRSMSTDFLTGAYNRKKLEMYMKEKIGASTRSKTFSAILIDFDDFKYINDTFGHDMGDYVLEHSVKLIKSCLGTFDFIARFGGDEFCIILETSSSNELEATVSKINRCIEKYNRQSNNPYQLIFSMGYAVYDYQTHMRVEEFQKQIDILMYENKRAHKENL